MHKIALFMPSHPVLKILLIAVIYYSAARFGLLMALGNTNASPVWPPSGFAFAAIIMLGYTAWPGILIGAFMANVVVFLNNDVSDTTTILVTSVFIAAGNTLEALTGYYLLARFNAKNILSRARDFSVFFITALFICMVSCTIGSLSLLITGIISGADYSTVWFTWWMGDVAGMLVLTPVLLAWWGKTSEKWSLKQLLRFAVSFILLTLYLVSVFGEWPPFGYYRAKIYLVFIFLIWCVFSMSLRQSSLVVLLIATFCIGYTLNGQGPFIEKSQNISLLSLQVFLCVVSVSTMFLNTTLNERKLSEQKLKELNENLEIKILERTKTIETKKEELEYSNKELQLFAHVASHDLQEPLRTIISFLQILEKKTKEKLTGEEEEYLQFAVGASKRLKKLIADLLSYAKIEKGELDYDPIDCTNVVNEVILNLKQFIRDNDAKIECAHLPVLQKGNKAQLIILFQNLINNAIKYRSPVTPRISITSTEEKNRWLFSIRDNGIGIEKQYHKKIFEMFQRLHGMDDYEGTGIGLATSLKIVENHGGEIWVESEPGKGAVFYFTLARDDS